MKTSDQLNDPTISCLNCQHELPAGADFCPECGTAGPTSETSQAALQTIGGLRTLDPTNTDPGHGQPLEIGTVIEDRFVIDELIGFGGMGVVYRATDKMINRTVALKLIRPGKVFGERELKRLKQEGVTARDIRHKNVVAVYDVREYQGQPFIVMEYLEGPSLRKWHREWKECSASVPMNKVRQIIEQILEGLAAAHEAGVVHRDLKPENVIVTENTRDSVRVKILDFGIARAIESGVPAEGALGTMGYMAPEQFTMADLAGPSADLYSVSVMFYELLADVIPCGHWQPPSAGRTDVAHRIDELIQHGLANRPASRIQSADEYLARLNDRPFVKPAALADVAAAELVQSEGEANTANNSDTAVKVFGIFAILGLIGFAGFMFLAVIAGLIHDDESESYDNQMRQMEQFNDPGTYPRPYPGQQMYDPSLRQGSW